MKKAFVIITALSIAALVLGLLISRRLWFRLDLSKNQMYTISAVSRALHTEIPDQVRLTYYLSEKLSAVHPMPREIEDLLREYAAYSHGKIQVVVRDPVKANLVNEVERLGILSQQIQTEEQDETKLATVYSGLVIEYLDQVEVLPVVFSLDTLEYDLTSRIRALVQGVTREAGVLIGDANRNLANDYQYVGQMLDASGFNVRQINAGDEIPGDLSVLFVFGGAEYLDDWALYRIDSYIQGGGKVLFAVEAVAVETEQGPPSARLMADKGLLAMVSRYGATVKPELVLDRSALLLRYASQTASGATQTRFVQYPLWIGVLPENANSKHPLTARFSGIDLFWPNHLELTPSEDISAEPLLSSTPGAWLETRDFQINPEGPAYFLEGEAATTTGQKLFAAALSGVFPSYFADMPKPVREGAVEALPDLPPARASRVIVIADTDVASAFIQRRQNLDFMVQATLWLCADEDIISIRSRQSMGARLDRITNQKQRVGMMVWARTLNVVLIPLAVISAGVCLAWQRQRRARGSQGD
ncbi:MAG: GldG family protein [Treponema sp.]|jgi:ABC-type uncharacterized transport system involved in gliding motility auxiliary subunit|nr:GldG family protein [Treponema sp.]